MATYITDRVIPDGSIGFNELNQNSGSFMFRNKIINGAMMIDQRNEGAAVTLTNSSAYCLDRMPCCAAGTATVQQVSDAPPGFAKSLRYTVVTPKTLANLDAAWIYQPIEGQNCIDLAYGTPSAKTITISFWVKCSMTGTFSGFWRTLTGTTATGTWRSYIFTYTINQTNVWEYKTITVPGNTQASFNLDEKQGVGVMFDMGSGTGWQAPAVNQWVQGDFYRAANTVRLNQTAGATYQITGLQVELGANATPFEWRPAGVELALCQRYFQEINNENGAEFWLIRASDVQNTYSGNFQLPVALRANPTMTNIVVYPDNRIHKPWIRWETYSSTTWYWNPRIPHRITVYVNPSNNDPASRAISLYGDRWFASAEL